VFAPHEHQIERIAGAAPVRTRDHCRERGDGIAEGGDRHVARAPSVETLDVHVTEIEVATRELAREGEPERALWCDELDVDELEAARAVGVHEDRVGEPHGKRPYFRIAASIRSRGMA
jgi:hypothetical protein